MAQRIMTYAEAKKFGYKVRGLAPQEEKKESFEDLVKKGFGKVNESAERRGNTVKNTPGGIGEEAQRRYAGITGQEYQYPEDLKEPGAQLGREIGRGIGGAAVTAPFALGGAALGGVPGLVAGSSAAGALTTPGTAADRLLEGAGEGATALLFAGVPAVGAKLAKALPLAAKYAGKTAKELKGLPKAIETLKSNPDVEGQFANARAWHNKFDEGSKLFYNRITEQLGERGVKQVPISPTILRQVKPHIPKDAVHQKLFEKAAKGNPEAIDKLQSFLGSQARAAFKGDSAERLNGFYLNSLRSRLNGNFANGLKKLGHEDLVDVNDIAKGLYKNMIDIYHEPEGIGVLFDPKVELRPKDIVKYFNAESRQTAPVRKFLEQHPEFKEALEKENLKRETYQKLKGLGKVGAGLGIAGGVGNWLFK